MDIVEIDTTILKVLIPAILLFTLLYQIWQIQKLKFAENILFIDYFQIRSLEISFAFIIIYTMVVFLALTILFSYNQLYINKKTCNPLMLYLGSKRACIRQDFENFENNNTNSVESFTDKLDFLGNIGKSPFVKMHSAYLAIIRFIYNMITTIQTRVDQFLQFWIYEQDKIIEKVYITLITPFFIKVTNPIYKSIRHILSYKYV